MSTKLGVPGLLLLAAAALLSCRDQQITVPAPQNTSFARVLHAGQFEDPCQAPSLLALRSATGEQVGHVTIWNGESRAYVRFTAPAGAEFAEVRVTGARHPWQFPRTGGAVDPGRFRFGGLMSPPESQVVIEALHLGNPYNVLPGEEVLLSAFARVQPVGGGQVISVWVQGITFDPGQHPMYLRYPVQTCGLMGEIAFVSGRHGNQEIYLVNADGTDVRRLTNYPAADDNPVWSPDGSRIAFVSQRDGAREIYGMRADGSDLQRLTIGGGSQPVWSSEGNRIVFVRDHGMGNQEIYVMNADGSDVVNLTNHPANDWQPVWSPDGSRIAFMSNRHGGNFEIYAMNVDGSDVQRLTNHPAPSAYPVWSPEGNRILFTSMRAGPYWNIFVMNADGSNVLNLSNTAANEDNPIWSPEGDRIAFSSQRNGDTDIYVMNADGSQVRRLTDSGGWKPVWSPNGRRIAFMSLRDGNDEIYSMNADGSEQVNLTNNPGWDAGPAWRP